VAWGEVENMADAPGWTAELISARRSLARASTAE
jgi:hypothetical protein